MEWFASSLAGAFYAVVFAKATVHFVAGYLLQLHLSPLVEAVTVRATALSVAGLFIYINYRGSSETGKVGAIFTIAQMLFVLAIGIAGVIVAIADPQRLANFQPFLKQIGGDVIPETVAARCDKPLVMVRAAGGIRSWIRRWI